MDNEMDSTIVKADADCKRYLLECIFESSVSFRNKLSVESLELVIHGFRPFDECIATTHR